LTSEKDLSVQTTYNAEYDYTEGGKLKNKLVVTQLDRYTGEDPHVKVKDGFKLFIYDSLEQVEAELSANTGIYREDELIMEAHENVILRNRAGEELHTEELIWLQDSGLVYTDKFVKIIRNEGVLFGKGLTSNESFTKYQIKQPTGEMKIELDSLKKNK
jgi:LPS export ABC transporter protein LptC